MVKTCQTIIIRLVCVSLPYKYFAIGLCVGSGRVGQGHPAARTNRSVFLYMCLLVHYRGYHMHSWLPLPSRIKENLLDLDARLGIHRLGSAMRCLKLRHGTLADAFPLFGFRRGRGAGGGVRIWDPSGCAGGCRARASADLQLQQRTTSSQPLHLGELAVGHSTASAPKTSSPTGPMAQPYVAAWLLTSPVSLSLFGATDHGSTDHSPQPSDQDQTRPDHQ